MHGWLAGWLASRLHSMPRHTCPARSAAIPVLRPSLRCSCPDGWTQLTKGVMPSGYTLYKNTEDHVFILEVLVDAQISSTTQRKLETSPDFGDDCLSGTGKVRTVQRPLFRRRRRRL